MGFRRLKQLMMVAVAVLVFAGNAFSEDKYVIDDAHTYIGFSVKHMMVSNVKGKFKEVSGTFIIDEKDMSKCVADITVQVASIDTDNEKRDTHLKSADFFDAEQFPAMTFKSKKLKKTKRGYTVTGDLTLRGVTKEVQIPFTAVKITDPQGKTRGGLEAEFKINRMDYGVKWNKFLDKGGLAVSNDVKIELQVEAVKE